MRKIMYDGALFILHRKLQPLIFSRRHRKSTLKRKSFRGFENAELLNQFFLREH